MANLMSAEIVRVERTIFSVKSLFANQAKKMAQVPEPKYKHFDDGRTLEIRFIAALESFHLLVLLAIIAEAQRDKQWQTPKGPNLLDLELREDMELIGKAATSNNLTVNLSYYSLAICMGRHPSTNLRRQIDKALDHLKGTQFIWHDEKGNFIESYNLISYIKFPSDSKNNALKISLCPVLSNVGKQGQPYTRISMDEVRNLKCLTSVLLHGWLSSIVAPGQKRSINVDTILGDVIWVQKTEKGSSTYRSRRTNLMKNLLPDLKNASWTWEYDEKKDQLNIKRPEIANDAKDKRTKKKA